MAENKNPDADVNMNDEEANEAVTRGTKRKQEEDEARDIVGGFRRSESAEPLDAALEELKEEEQRETRPEQERR
jgi:hypothetical protein